MSAENDTTKRLTSADRVALIAGCVPLLAGVLVMALIHGTVAGVIGICLIALCGVAVVVLVFLLTGESEDRHYRKGTL